MSESISANSVSFTTRSTRSVPPGAAPETVIEQVAVPDAFNPSLIRHVKWSGPV